MFEHRTRQGGYEQRWSEVKDAILHTAEGTLKKKWKKRKKWITESTLELTEKKRKAFLIWQEDRKNEHKRQEYRGLCKYVRRSVRADKEKWIDGMMKGMEEDMKRNRLGNFFKKLKNLMGKTGRRGIIVDENGEQLTDGKDRLGRWKRHFESVLNVGSSMSVELQNSQSTGDDDLAELTIEEVRNAVKRLKNGKAAGDDGVVAELLKYGGEDVIEWMFEVLTEVWRERRFQMIGRNQF